MSGIFLGTAFTLHGIFCFLLFIPKNVPINISGKVQKIHKNKREAKSEILTAAVDFSIDKIILTKTYPKNKVPGNRTD